jgi:hypothetical protein
MALIDERLLKVDRNGCIAVPGTLWLAMAFLARYWIVVIAIVGSARKSPETVTLLGGDFSWYMLALELPAIVVMLAAGLRKPTAHAFWRGVWTHARAILIATALMNIAAAAVVVGVSPVFRRWPELFVASCAVLDLAVLYALAKDAFFRQLFADFPPPAQPARTSP